jgi:carboxyl-terminal processing protease
LRFNGGGSLSEVIKMVGLFIEDGPVVQVKEKEGKPSVLYDRDKTVLYNGPFVVMVNELSASASEIFAAAIQDYKRGVIVGSTSTFGKGTVQRSIPFGKPLDFFNGSTEFGEVKLTLQKFYRINGGSTQLKGVIPDIIIPDQYEYMKIREKDYPTALPWDEITKSNYKTWNADFNLADLKSKSESRIKDFVGFSLINNNAQWLSKENDRVYNLNLIEYQNNTKKVRETIKQINSIVNLDKEMNVIGLSIDNYKYNNVDKEKGERYKQWIKNLRKDIYLNEAANIVSDIVNSNSTKTVKK